MKSHRYQIQRSDLFRALGLPLCGVLLIGLIVHLSSWLPFAPTPRPALDVDRTVIIQQIDSSETTTDAEILLIGDSSCLMNVDAALLEGLAKTRAINLGTLSFLDLDTFGSLLSHYLDHQTSPPKWIILLTHPDFVRKNSASQAHTNCFNRYLEKQDHLYNHTPPWSPEKYLGIHIVEGRLLARLPLPLNNAFGRYYGFTSDLSSFMVQHQGSAVDPRSLDLEQLKGSSDYRVARSHKRLAASFLERIPSGTAFFVGLTPVPKSFPQNDFVAEYQALLNEWARLFPGCIALSQLPPVLDNEYFATKTHLTQAAATHYTRVLLENIGIDEVPTH